MTQLALNKGTNDLYKPDGGGVTRVSLGRFTVQQVQSKLKTILNEWLLDTRVGWVNQKDFDRNFDQFEIENRARKIILETQGVKSITFIKTTYSNRKLEVQFEAETIYGTINQTIPWDNSGL